MFDMLVQNPNRIKEDVVSIEITKIDENTPHQQFNFINVIAGMRSLRLSF